MQPSQGLQGAATVRYQQSYAFGCLLLTVTLADFRLMNSILEAAWQLFDKLVPGSCLRSWLRSFWEAAEKLHGSAR